MMLAYMRVDDLATSLDLADGGDVILGHHAAVTANVGA